MKIVKEAYTENCKVVLDPEYITIGHHKGEPIHMSLEEAKEIVEWLSTEFNNIFTESSPVIPKAKTYEGVDFTKKPTQVYEPGPRLATQTVEIKVGDPFLAHRSSGGRTSVAGDGDAGITDLGALAAKVGRV